MDLTEYITRPKVRVVSRASKEAWRAHLDRQHGQVAALIGKMQCSVCLHWVARMSFETHVRRWHRNEYALRLQGKSLAKTHGAAHKPGSNGTHL